MIKKLFRVKKLNNKGFTFVECIVAVALFAIIGTLAFSMFSNSTRYMSKAKKEEAKQSQSITALQEETFMYNGKHIIYSSDKLVEEKVTTNDALSTFTKSLYYINMTYMTDYGAVTKSVAITRSGDLITGGLCGYYKYFVSGDAGTQRYLYIYDAAAVNEFKNYTDDKIASNLAKD